MNFKRKVLYTVGSELSGIKFSDNGDWNDIYCPKTVQIKAPSIAEDGKFAVNVSTVDLEISMKMPSGMEAIIAPRSSSFDKFGFILSNSLGVVDNSYCGPNDTWKAKLVGIRRKTITAGDRILQFRLQVSQKASLMDKLKHLFCTGYEFVCVDSLPKSEDRGGYGSSGK